MGMALHYLLALATVKMIDIYEHKIHCNIMLPDISL